MRDPTVTDCPDGCDCPESDKMHRIRLLEKRLAAAEADRDALLAEIQKWREGRAYLGTPMTYVDQRLVDETWRLAGNRRAVEVKP